MRRPLILIALAAALAACSNDKTAPDAGAARDAEPAETGTTLDAEPAEAGEPDAGLVVDPDCDRWLEATCAYLSKCESWAPNLAERSRDLCHPLDRARRCALLAGAAAKDRINFARDRVAACVAALESTTCEVNDGKVGPSACARVFEPRAGTGDVCAEHEECVDGYCDQSASCPGHCVAKKDVNVDCASTLECGSGLFCNGTCTEKAGAGTRCIAGNGEDSCVEGYYCEGSIVQPGLERCEPIGQVEGDRCAQPWFGPPHCASGLICQDGICVRGGQDGALCNSSMRCGVALRCTDESGGNCAPAAGPDQACTGTDQCPPRFACVSGRCAPLPVEAESCSNKVPCRRGSCVSGVCKISNASAACEANDIEPCDQSWCSGSSGMCVAVKADGTNCIADFECEQTSRCVGGSCQPCLDP